MAGVTTMALSSLLVAAAAAVAQPAPPAPDWAGSTQFAVRGGVGSVVATGHGAPASDAPFHAQAQTALARILARLGEAGLGPEDVARTRIYVADIGRGADIARAHKAAFDAHRPTIVMAQVDGLPDGTLVAVHAELMPGPAQPRRLGRGGPLEERYGYALAYARDGHGGITGLTGMGPGGAIPAGHGALEQARTALSKLQALLSEQGLSHRDVVRTRLYVTAIDELEAYATAHRDVFGEHPPATTVVQVARLFTPDMKLELDADFARLPTQRLSGGSRWEPWFGFSRTVVAGPRVSVSGTTAEGDLPRQAEAVLDTIQAQLARAGAGWRDVVHMNVIHRDDEDLAVFRAQLAQRTGGALPVLMPIRVARLAGGTMRLDVDAEAWVGAGSTP